jgi:hypothetical protein
LSADFRFGVDYFPNRIPCTREKVSVKNFIRKSTRHKTACKADNIARRWDCGDAAVAKATRLRGFGDD